MSTAPTPGTDSPIANNNPITPVSESRLKKFTEKVSPYTTILGAVNDVVGLSGVVFSALTIISTVLFVRSASEAPTFIFTQNPITGEHMLALWTITAYAYFGLTRKAYDKATKEGFTGSYTKYFTSQLIVGFKKPLLSILFGIVLIVFALVMSAVSEFTFAIIAIPLSIILLFALIINFNPSALSERDRQREREEVVKAFNNFLTNHWSICEKLITERLVQHNYLSYQNLHDFAKVHSLNKEQVEYLLARYATTYTRRVKYGFLYRNIQGTEKRQPRCVVLEYEGGEEKPVRVLVSLKYYNQYKDSLYFLP
jgi:hypothetical protein